MKMRQLQVQVAACTPCMYVIAYIDCIYKYININIYIYIYNIDIILLYTYKRHIHTYVHLYIHTYNMINDHSDIMGPWIAIFPALAAGGFRLPPFRGWNGETCSETCWVPG